MSTIQCPPLPIDTARAAESVFGREHPYLKIGMSLENVWAGLNLSKLGFKDPFLSNSFYPCSLVTLMQYWEVLTDRQMSLAIRTRLDMKYAMHLPLNFPGIEPSSLCRFRQYVLGDGGAKEALQKMMNSLSSFVERENLHVSVNRMISDICLPNRVEAIFESMGMALEAIAAEDPNWLKIHTLPHWYRRYHLKMGNQKIPSDPKELDFLIRSIGNDGWHLLSMIDQSNLDVLSRLSEIQNLREEWKHQFAEEDQGVKFRESHCLSCSELMFIENLMTRKEESRTRGT